MPNYNAMKHEELYKLIDKYDLEKADYMTKKEDGKDSLNVKKLSNILKLIDIQAGHVDKAQVIDENGNVSDHKPTKKFAKGFSGMMAKITFYNSEENDLPYVQLALNGTALIIPREKEVWIPREFIDGVLVNAVITKMKMDVDRDGKIRYIPKQVPRISYTVADIKHIDVVRKEYDEEKANKK